MEHVLPVLHREKHVDFPEGCDCSRRDFLRTACAPAVFAALGITIASCDSQDPLNGGGGGGTPITLDLTSANAQALTSAGGFVFLGNENVIVANVDGTTIRAFRSICTHQGNVVNSFSNGRFLCSNRTSGHGSQYNTSGQPVAGPAPSALREYTVTRDGNTLTINRS